MHLAVYMNAMRCAIAKPSAACRGKIALCEACAWAWDYKGTVMASPSREAADLGSVVLVSVAAACECSVSSHICHRLGEKKLVLAAAQNVLLPEDITCI